MANDETAFPTLDATQISFLETLGERQSIGVGEYLYRSGDDAYDFFVIVWCPVAFRCSTLPFRVIRNRLAAARWLVFFGIASPRPSPKR